MMQSEGDAAKPTKKAKVSFFRPYFPSVSENQSSIAEDIQIAKIRLDYLENDDLFFPYG